MAALHMPNLDRLESFLAPKAPLPLVFLACTQRYNNKWLTRYGLDAPAVHAVCVDGLRGAFGGLGFSSVQQLRACVKATLQLSSPDSRRRGME